MKPFLNAFRQLYLTQKIDHYPGKYMPNGLKPIEAFYSDISRNLVKWAAGGGSIYYETKEYWYCFTVERAGTSSYDLYDGIVWMRRFDIDSSKQMIYFANTNSITNIGKKWLINRTDKRVAVE